MLIFKSKTEKTSWLLELANQDAFLKSIVEDLQKFGFEIKYSLLGRAGEYRPQALQTNVPINDAFLDTLKISIEAGEMPAKFKLSPRFGKSHMAHTFLHELIHFYQDMSGLFLTPLEHGSIIQPDLKSHIEITLLCEAMAATEAIKASLRLKKEGRPEAWNGAFWSLDWHDLTKNYTRDIGIGRSESEAAQNCFNGWYKSRLRHYYERRAFETYKNHGQEHRSVNMAELITLLPENQRPQYLNALKPALTREYKSSNNPNWQNIQIGSPPYLWKKFISS